MELDETKTRIDSLVLRSAHPSESNDSVSRYVQEHLTKDIEGIAEYLQEILDEKLREINLQDVKVDIFECLKNQIKCVVERKYAEHVQQQKVDEHTRISMLRLYSWLNNHPIDLNSLFRNCERRDNSRC